MDKLSNNIFTKSFFKFTGLAIILPLAITLAACDGSENLIDPNAEPKLDEKGMIIWGARLYDNWIKLKIADGITVDIANTDNPLWNTRSINPNNIKTGYDTWRCVNCHGWDYQGTDGDFGPDNTASYTGFTGLMLTSENIQNGRIREDAINAITDGFTNQDQVATNYHAFGKSDENTNAWLSGQDIDALILFIEKGMIETQMFIAAYVPLTDISAVWVTPKKAKHFLEHLRDQFVVHAITAVLV